MSKHCELCGNKNRNYDHQFCSVRCRNTNNARQQKRKGLYKDCIICGNQFYVHQSDLKRRTAQCCSTKCSGIAKSGKNNYNYRGKIKVRCQYCNKEFETYLVRIKQKRAKFCSRKCGSKWWGQSKISQGRIQQYTIDFAMSCDNCDKSIQMTYKNLALSNHHFCSRDCYAKFKIKPLDEKESILKKTCLFCGELFWGNIYDHKKGMAKFCSMKCMGGYRSAHGSKNYTSGRGGKRKDLDDLYVRSSWEANYARYLKWLKELGEIKDWEYEADTFEFKKIKKGTRFYTPDFKITNNDGTIEYHETKGYMDKRSKTKLKRMKKYYPEVKIVLIDADAYYAIAKHANHLIPNWETIK